MAYTISVFSRKGGVGKSTTTLNLAKALQLLGKKVLVVDMDAQASATKTLGEGIEDDDKRRISIIMVQYLLLLEKGEYADFTGLVKSSIFTVEEGLDLLAAAGDTKYDNMYITSMDNKNTERFTVLTELLKTVKEDYDFILIDCPPSSDLITSMVLHASDYLLNVVRPDGYVDSAMLDTIKIVYESLSEGGTCKILGVLINMVQNHTQDMIAIELVYNVSERYSFPVLEPMIPMRVAIKEGPLYGEVVAGSTLKRNEEYANLYRELANNIIERCGG